MLPDIRRCRRKRFAPLLSLRRYEWSDQQLVILQLRQRWPVRHRGVVQQWRGNGDGLLKLDSTFFTYACCDDCACIAFLRVRQVQWQTSGKLVANSVANSVANPVANLRDVGERFFTRTLLFKAEE